MGHARDHLGQRADAGLQRTQAAGQRRNRSRDGPIRGLMAQALQVVSKMPPAGQGLCPRQYKDSGPRQGPRPLHPFDVMLFFDWMKPIEKPEWGVRGDVFPRNVIFEMAWAVTEKYNFRGGAAPSK